MNTAVIGFQCVSAARRDEAVPTSFRVVTVVVAYAVKVGAVSDWYGADAGDLLVAAGSVAAVFVLRGDCIYRQLLLSWPLTLLS